MQLFADTDIDQAIAEFVKATFEGERRDIELLKSRIAALKRDHKNTAILQHQLVLKVAQQMQREMKAEAL